MTLSQSSSDSCVEDVDAAEAGEDRPDLVLVGDIATGLDVERRYPRTSLFEERNRRGADSSGAARDDGNLSVQIEEFHEQARAPDGADGVAWEGSIASARGRPVPGCATRDQSPRLMRPMMES